MLLLLALLQDAQCALQIRCSRRALGSAALAATLGSTRARATHAAEPTYTAMDAFQLKASYNGLDDALQAWRIEIAQVQLGNEPASVVAVAGLSDTTLQRLSESGGSLSVEQFKQHKNALLQQLYLARGAARYEKDPQVAVGYIDKAKLEAESARADLGAIGTTLGIDLGKSKRAAQANPEDAVVFQPRVAPRTENRITF